MAQSGHGKIYVFEDFLGHEIDIATASEHDSATGSLWNLGAFSIRGQDLDQVDAGAESVADGLNGQVILTSSAHSDADSCFLSTDTCLKPSVNAPMSLEVRGELAALTTRAIFIGFNHDADEAQTDVLTGSGTTLTLTEAGFCGFFFDSQLTEKKWHCVYNGGSTTGATDSTTVDSGVAPVAGDMQVLRLEIDNNGTARYFIDGVLKQTTAGAIAPTTVFAMLVGVVSTSTTAGSLTLDYVELEAFRDWTL